MDEKEYLACDEEVFAMVNNRERQLPQVAALVPMEKLRQMERFEQQVHQMKRCGTVAAPLCVGLLAVGAMARDLMAPGLAIVTLGACILWGAVKAWRVFYGKTQNSR